MFVTFSLFQSSSPTCSSKSWRGESKFFHYKGRSFSDAKIPVPPSPRPKQSWPQRGHAISPLFSRCLAEQTMWAFGRCHSHRGFNVIFLLNSGQPLNAELSLSPKVWFNGSSYCLSLILKWFATCLIEIEVMSTYIFWVLNSCEPLTMRCRAASKKWVQKKHSVIGGKIQSASQAHRLLWILWGVTATACGHVYDCLLKWPPKPSMSRHVAFKTPQFHGYDFSKHSTLGLFSIFHY